MKIHPNELFIYYDPSTNSGKQTRAYAYSISNHVNETEYHKVRFTSTMWRDLLDMLGLRPKDLLNRAHPDYQSKIAGNNYDDEGWLNVIINYPYLIKAPIAVMNDKAILCIKPTDILKLDKHESKKNRWVSR